MARKKTTETTEVATIPSIGGDVTPVFIDNSANKPESEAEQRYLAGVESAKKQRAELRKAEKKAEKDA
jgi:hypothetical protein